MNTALGTYTIYHMHNELTKTSQPMLVAIALMEAYEAGVQPNLHSTNALAHRYGAKLQGFCLLEETEGVLRQAQAKGLPSPLACARNT